MLQEEEVEMGAWRGKKGGTAQAMVEEEEEELTDYTLSPARKGRASGPKKTQSRGGGASHPSRKKGGGPCVSCHVASKLPATASFCVYSIWCAATQDH